MSNVTWCGATPCSYNETHREVREYEGEKRTLAPAMHFENQTTRENNPHCIRNDRPVIVRPVEFAALNVAVREPREIQAGQRGNGTP